jgi:hypothetical protein
MLEVDAKTAVGAMIPVVAPSTDKRIKFLRSIMFSFYFYKFFELMEKPLSRDFPGLYSQSI